MRRQTIGIIVAALIALTGLGVAGYVYYADQNQQAATNGSSNTSGEPDKDGSQTTPAGTSTDQPDQPKTYKVSVFFSKHPESDDDPSKVFPVTRTSPDLGVGRFAISELLKGPTAAESAQGYFSTATFRTGSESTCGGDDFTLKIEGGTATLKFCRQFDHRGVVADGQADSILKATLRQFSTVKKVVILNPQNNCEFDLSGQNLCLQ
jgi:hypothetical protein